MIINKEDKLFPQKLKDIKPEVTKIYVKGNPEILNDFGIAVIGSRNSSKEGERLTEELVRKLVKYNINIISGLALGIDTKSHTSCITNGGKTIAIIGSGFDYIYPKENKELFKKIIETGGAIVSEYPPDTQAKPENFPKRNRIVSGLSDGVLMIEGKYRSGTTITAGYALKQGKPVFCLPHSIYNQYGVGPNEIIKKGGRLVTNAKDIINYYESKGLIFEEKVKKETHKDDILELLQNQILTKEELARKLHKSISEINQQITVLELEGLIQEEYRERI